MAVIGFVIITALSLGCGSKPVSADIVAPSTKAAESNVKPNKKNAKSAKENDSLSLIKETVKKYSETSSVEAKIEKKVSLALLGEERKSDGEIFISKGRVRIEIDKPDRSLIVMGPDVIWVVTPEDKDLGNKTQVAKIKSKSTSSQARAPLALLLGKANTWDKFKILKTETTKAGKTLILLEPKEKESLGEVVKIQMEIDSDKKEFSSVAYWDDIDNMTQFTFLKSKFDSEIPDRKFNYIPPKDAEVTVFE